ncbi:LPS export ABC transporter ATP-binding protein [candidate division WOR-3 bacterium]|nr:LPS export ABC transporter ATP-binding protein [candidate division WOR-3 bacterium]
MSELLVLKELVKSYNGRKVVDGVSLELRRGEIVGLLGPNGAGKTTTFYMTVGVIPPDRGKVFLDDREITRLPMYMRARLGIGYLPQEASIFRRLTVEDNIKCVLEFQPLSSKDRRERLEELISLMQLEPIRHQLAYTLSGGERRRVEIARALATRPDFLLLDEPFTGIDPIIREEIQEIVLMLKRRGIGILITDHNVRETLEVTDRAYIIYEGKILVSGEAQTLINDPEARRIYLGKRFRM